MTRRGAARASRHKHPSPDVHHGGRHILLVPHLAGRGRGARCDAHSPISPVHDLGVGRQSASFRAVSSSHCIYKERADASRAPRLSLAQKPSTALSLGPSDVLKLTFQVVDKEGGKGVQPHQTFLRFYDEVTGEEGIQPVKVTPGGKAKFELVSTLDSATTRHAEMMDTSEHGAPAHVPSPNHHEPAQGLALPRILRSLAGAV